MRGINESYNLGMYDGHPPAALTSECEATHFVMTVGSGEKNCSRVHLIMLAQIN